MEYPATRGRKPVETEIIDAPKIDEAETNALIVAAAEWDRNARALATQIGYVLPADSTNPDLICRDIAANMRRSMESVLEIGRGLLVLKTICGHGNFMECIESLGIEQRLANRFMAAGVKFSKWTSTSTLLPKIASGTKLFELLVLDDEQVDELAGTGQTGELKLDDVACMGVRELRKAVRELRGKVDAKDKVAQSNQKTINDLQERLVAREEAAPEDEEGDDAAPSFEELQEELTDCIRAARSSVMDVLTAIEELGKSMPDGPALDAAKLAAWQTLLGDVRQYAIITGTALDLGQTGHEIVISEAQRLAE